MADKISAGEAYVSVSVNNTDLKKGLQDASSQISAAALKISAIEPELSPKIEIAGWDQIKSSLKDVRDEIEKTATSGRKLSDRLVITAGDIYNALTGTVKKLTTALGGLGDQFDKMSQRTGVSTAALSEYGHAAQLCGADVGAIEGAIRSMQSKIGDANAGMERSRKIFERLGVDLVSLSALSPESQFDALASAVASVVDPTERASIALKVFSSDGQRLLPMFNQGADGIRNMREEARALGVSIDENSAKMGADFIDATTRLKASLTGLTTTFAATVTPVITLAADRLSGFNATINSLVHNNSTLIKGLVYTIGGMATLTSGIFATQKAMNALRSAAFACGAAVKIALSPVGSLALVAGIAAVAAMFSKASNSAKQFKDDAQNALDSGSATRSEDRSVLERLETLYEIQKTQKLSNDQIVEAASLAEQLRQKYGLIGVSVDAVGKKIEIAADAQERLNAQMLEARKNELKAAIDEAETNLQDDRIDKKLAKEEVSGSEFWLGRKRGGKWWESGLFRLNKDDDDLRLWILENDEGFQKRVEKEKATQRARLESYKAEYEAIVKTEQSTSNQKPTLDYDESALKQGADIVAGYVAEASKKEQTELDARIDRLEQKRKELVDELRKLADPNGEIDWTDEAAVKEFADKNATYRGVLQLEVQVNETIDKQIEDAKAEAAKKAEAEATRKIEEVERSLAETEKRWADESRSDLEKKLVAIDEETEKYREQLRVLYELEAAKDKPDQNRLWELWGADAAASARADDKRDQTIRDAMNKAADKFATPAEKFFQASRELQTAIIELETARDSGDQIHIVAALNQLGEASDKYDSLEQAIDRIGESVGKSVGGTFNAWQAAATRSTDWNKQIFNENRTQTSYLREIARKIGRNTVVFG